MFEVVQGSARVLNIKKTRKTRGRGLISGGGAYNRINIFVSKQNRNYNRNFTVCGSGKQVDEREANRISAKNIREFHEGTYAGKPTLRQIDFQQQQ